jgi:hypothetical protein
MAQAATSGYPVQTSFSKPERYDRIQLLWRLGIWMVLGAVTNGVLGFAYFAGPIVSAIFVSRHGADGFHEKYGAKYAKFVSFYADLQTYFLFGTDEFPSWGKEGAAHYSYQPSGSPTVGSALLRLIMVIPHAIMGWVLGIIIFGASLVAIVTVLMSETVSEGIWGILMGIVAWEARVLTYFLSMVEEYPPFSLDKEVRGA